VSNFSKSQCPTKYPVWDLLGTLGEVPALSGVGLTWPLPLLVGQSRRALAGGRGRVAAGHWGCSVDSTTGPWTVEHLF
jgi:hypothetical protein